MENHRRIKIIEEWIPPQEVALYYNNASLILNPHRSHLFPQNKNKNKVKIILLIIVRLILPLAKAFKLLKKSLIFYRSSIKMKLYPITALKTV